MALKKVELTSQEASEKLAQLGNSAAAALTPKDLVYVKEGWNKILAFRSKLFFEALAERWFFLAPSVVDRLQLEAEDMHNFLYAWLDLCVHSFCPETETMNRETFQPIHVSYPQRFQTLTRYGLQLAILGVDAKEMLALDDAWYFALETHAPYFEDVDRSALVDRDRAPLVRMFRGYHIAAYLRAIERHAYISEAIKPVCELWNSTVGCGREQDVGRRFYELLFSENVELMDYFVDTDMEAISKHLMGYVLFCQPN